MTIKQLYDLCDLWIKNGRGDKHIYISSDDEGNDRHELLYGFTKTGDEYIEEDRLEDMRNHHGGEKNCVLLG